MNFVLNLNKFNTLDLLLSHTGVPMANHWKFILLERKKKESPGLGLAKTKINAVCKGNSMIGSDIRHKYHKWYVKIVIRWDNFEISQVVFLPNIT